MATLTRLHGEKRNAVRVQSGDRRVRFSRAICATAREDLTPIFLQNSQDFFGLLFKIVENRKRGISLAPGTPYLFLDRVKVRRSPDCNRVPCD
jgi:hypothetical protein